MKILLIDNHALFRAGLCHILQQLPGGVNEILEAGSFSDGLKFVDHNPDLDLVLLELKSPGCKGAISVKLFRLNFPQIPLVVVSSEEDRHIQHKVIGYGASSFVGKSSTVPMLLSALSLAQTNRIQMPPQQQHSLTDVNNRNEDCRTNANEYGLTVRQMDVLKYIFSGLSNKEIAEAINLTEGTVKVHVAAVYQTLRVKNRIEAIHLSKRIGLKLEFKGCLTDRDTQKQIYHI